MQRTLIGLALLLLLSSACSRVGPKERGIRLHSGSADAVLQPGMHFYFPVFFAIDTIDLSIRKDQEKTGSSSKDLQEIQTTIAINWALNEDKLLDAYKTLGRPEEIFEKIISPSVHEILKSSTSKKTAEEILTKRLEVKEEIDRTLSEKMKFYGLRLFDVSIINLQFSHEFTQAIERKQIAEQDAKRSIYIAEKAKNEADAEVNTARGRAKAQELLQASTTDKILRQQAVEKWDGKLPQIMGSGSLPFIQLNLKNE